MREYSKKQNLHYGQYGHYGQYTKTEEQRIKTI